MFSQEECASKYKRLLQLIEIDDEEIAEGLQGELLTAYRQVLEYEKNQIMNEIRSINITY